MIDIDVTYSQLAVFDGGLANPFSMWRDSHIRQGFVWRRNAVTFMTLSEEGRHHIAVTLGHVDQAVVREALRAIQVPFTVSAPGSVEIGSITDTKMVKVPPGEYALICAFMPRSQGRDVALMFVPGHQAEFRILQADRALADVNSFDLGADPA